MLDERKASILRAVVEEYIQTAQPVGSGHIAAAPGVQVSSATVRNEMAALETEGFRSPAYVAVHRAVVEAGGAASGLTDRAWLDAVLAACPDDAVRAVVHELAVEPLPIDEADVRYAQAVLARLLEIDASRRIADLKARLQRIEPASEPDAYQALFADVLALEKYRRGLREQVAGGAS